MRKYQPLEIEKKWQEKWDLQKIYGFTPEKGKKSHYVLVEFPYPSGNLHLGHWFTFIPADVYARFRRMRGDNVFFPIGFDAFGLPAEGAAIKHKIHPQEWTLANIKTMSQQFRTMGTMLNWEQQVITCLPEYYQWNQWIFLEMLKKGLAYRGKKLSNWCPIDKTVLADEAIEDGNCWRCGNPVEQKEIAQWFLRLTAYAERLLWENTEKKISNGVDWPKSVREGQNNWIGKSEGALLKFQISNSYLAGRQVKFQIEVFTTRPDTLYGATFLALAPEHPIVASLLNFKFQIPTSPAGRSNFKLDAVKAYVKQAKNKTEMERKEMKEKTGVFSGLYGIHPLTGEKLPVWLADYVLLGYGTGAIMAVPGHDARDFEFAKKYNLGIKQVIKPESSSKKQESGRRKSEDLPFTGEGKLINSGEWDGWHSKSDLAKVLASLKKQEIGLKQTNYHLHDWSISRQRYWGTPVPVIYCHNCWNVKFKISNLKLQEGVDYVIREGKEYAIVPVPEEKLPVTLPYEVDYLPKGMPPLATASQWMKVKCPNCGLEAEREPETLDTFFDSSWYFLRYLNPQYKKGPFPPDLARELTPVNIYFGGAEHTLGHTLYARFFTKFFHETGLLEYEEFALKRVQHGIILGPDGNKMSKSKGNVVNPDDVVNEYGADTVRLYLCFMMPLEATAPWNPTAIAGIYRFLRRVWELKSKVKSENLKVTNSSEDLYLMHKTIQKVTNDILEVKMNTAIASLMEWLNHLSRKNSVSSSEYEALIILLAPFAPHITEEIWQNLQREDSVHTQPWPAFDKKYLAEQNVTIVIQVNGKMRDVIRITNQESGSKKNVEALAKESGKVQAYLKGKEVRKVIHVPGKILNFVV